MDRNRKSSAYRIKHRVKKGLSESLLRGVPASGSEADKFLLRGAAHPSRMQRAAAWIFGAVLVGIGVVLVDAARGAGFFPLVLSASFFLLLGIWIFRNGFARADRRKVESGRPEVKARGSRSSPTIERPGP